MLSVILVVIEALLALFVSWLVASIPVWVGAKLFSASASIGKAMVATLVALIVFFLLVTITSPLLSTFSLVVGFLGVLLVFKAIFSVGWGGALGIAFFATLVAFALVFLLGLMSVFLHPSIIHHIP
ncbi:hypothetical protein HS1genome_2252 [Sulfodiicoccus acidiphilus]|uniref:Phage holin family protein n=1 Tax=Sulfodiicoccus acidiphilus TaxID=1670455 RepID=A0A348B6R1_9CREN|nr:hypothetical protein [Sulfodiicoccus acidiphilus]BBD73863.1 hypothetical protein HS1genome_2252 [Sulfodiicoccus acidiphilus]GGT96248.1 hypothetical protein GCM10007116_12240 [Sulfodiicoccus acidiphilus]